ncbi:hypothetical protein KEM56_006763 [Ascosphaera pollenicola]|nr:hypothetical protein KEM56_006763 [Ascosphaera pollenicola]
MAKKASNANRRGRGGVAKQPTRRSQRQAARTTKTEESVPDEPGQVKPAPAAASPSHVRKGSAAGGSAAPAVNETDRQRKEAADSLLAAGPPYSRPASPFTQPDHTGSIAWAGERYVCTPILAAPYEGGSPQHDPRFKGYKGPPEEAFSPVLSPCSPSRPATSQPPRKLRAVSVSRQKPPWEKIRSAGGWKGANVLVLRYVEPQHVSLDFYRDLSIPVPRRSNAFDRPLPALDPSPEPKAKVGSRGPLQPVPTGTFNESPTTAAANVDAWLADKHKGIYVPLPPDPEARDYYTYCNGSLGVLRYRTGEAAVFKPIPDESYLPIYTRILWQRLEEKIADAIKNNRGGGLPTRESFMQPVFPSDEESNDNSARANRARTRVDHYKRRGVNLHVELIPSPERPASPTAHRKPGYVGDTHEDAVRNFMEGSSCTSSPNHRGIPIPSKYRENGIPYDASRRFNSPVPPSGPVSNDSSNSGKSDDASDASSEDDDEEMTALIDGCRHLTTQAEVQYYVGRLESCTRRLRRLTARMGKVLRILDNELKDEVNDLVNYTDLAPIIERARRILTRCHQYLLEFEGLDAQGIRPYCKKGRTVLIGGKSRQKQLQKQPEQQQEQPEQQQEQPEQQQEQEQRQESPLPMGLRRGEPETSDPAKDVVPSAETPKGKRSGKEESSVSGLETGN